MASNATPIRTMRIPDEVWQAAIRGTAYSGTSVTAVVTEFLRQRFLSTETHDPEPDQLPCEHCKICGQPVACVNMDDDKWEHL